MVPIPVDDPGPARARLHEALAQLAAVASSQDVAAGVAAGVPGIAAAVTAAREAVDAAQAEVDACAVDVLLQAPPAAVAEAVVGAWLDESGALDDDALPDLLAACADEEGLRDAEWWRVQLARREWGRNEVAGLRLAVMHLVMDPVRPLVPKG